MNFNRDIFLNNIAYLTDKNGIKIGDIEKSANVSAGYISRLRKDENKVSPSIDVISSFAESLNVSIDSFINIDFSKETPTEEFIRGFLSKLIKDSVNFLAKWQIEPIENYAESSHVMDKDSLESKPLCEVKEINEDSGCEFPNKCYYTEYTSKFHPKQRVVATSVLKLVIGHNTTIFLVQSLFNTSSDPIPQTDIELYLINRNEVNSLCNAINDSGATLFSTQLNELYNSAINVTQHIQISNTTKGLIERYLDGSDDVDPDDNNFY